MIKDLLRETQAKMQKGADTLSEELRGIRTGRASPALVERLAVEYYGTMTPLNQVATISAPEPRLLAIRPWETSMIGPIEKAILKSDLGLTPSNDGKLIRLTIPRLSEERREELVRVVARRVEEAKVTLRNLRRDANDELKLYEEEKLISEDELHRGRDQIQELTDEYVSKLDEIGALKEAEIREV
ncbi:MAG: ribosome recycling factor [Anaerolineae bacterium]|nr:ribosome recycling factor [Anaerolineae bacterium]